MDDFLKFANTCGLVIDYVRTGKITRCATIDHPHKQNGAFLFNGDWGWCQDWSKTDKPEIWVSGDSKITRCEIQKQIRDSNRERDRLHMEAARKAAWMIKQAKPGIHNYLSQKGFPDSVGLVMEREGKSLLLIPMRIENNISGLQIISQEVDGFRKTFLKGSKTKGACYTMGRGGKSVYCEGYATGLSIHRAVTKSNIPAHVVVCFSAANMAHLAKSGFVIADNDASGVGEKYAIQTGLPYFLPPDTGMDFNDFEIKHGRLNAMMQIKKLLSL